VLSAVLTELFSVEFTPVMAASKTPFAAVVALVRAVVADEPAMKLIWKGALHDIS
jgi:hypothetical protein